MASRGQLRRLPSLANPLRIWQQRLIHWVRYISSPFRLRVCLFVYLSIDVPTYLPIYLPSYLPIFYPMATLCHPLFPHMLDWRATSNASSAKWSPWPDVLILNSGNGSMTRCVTIVPRVGANCSHHFTSAYDTACLLQYLLQEAIKSQRFNISIDHTVRFFQVSAHGWGKRGVRGIAFPTLYSIDTYDSLNPSQDHVSGLRLRFHVSPS